MVKSTDIVIRQWELSSNSTHYDRKVAAPSNNDLVIMWTTWSTISFVTVILILFVFLPIVRSKDITKTPLNVYIVLIMIPDILFSFSCGISCLANALHGHYTKAVWTCKIQSFYTVFAITASSWMNAITFYQLYNLLDCSQKCQRYKPPSTRNVLLQGCLVLLFSCIISSMGIWDVWWLPLRTRLTIGATCGPVEYDTSSTIFVYVFFVPCVIGLPCAYIMYCGYRIYKRQLLPPKGRRRFLGNFFARLATAIFVMWVPGLLLHAVISPFTTPWVQFVGGIWSHLQGIVSAAVTFHRPDIYATVLEFWYCSFPGANLLLFSTKQVATTNKTTQCSFRAGREELEDFYDHDHEREGEKDEDKHHNDDIDDDNRKNQEDEEGKEKYPCARLCTVNGSVIIDVADKQENSQV